MNLKNKTTGKKIWPKDIKLKKIKIKIMITIIKIISAMQVLRLAKLKVLCLKEPKVLKND